MRFLLLSSTYYPEKKSASYMLKALTESFLVAGHSVTVLTFSHELASEVVEEEISGVSVIRIRVSDPKFSKIRRALVELSFSRKVINYIKRNDLGDLDGLIFFAPSIFFGRAVMYIKKYYSIKSYMIVRDIFPDWLVKIKQLRKGLIYYFFKYFEYINFKSADFIGTESKSDIDHVNNVLRDSNCEVEQLRNWFAKPDFVGNENRSSDLVSDSELNLIYGGSLGLAQDLYSFLQLLENQEFAKLINIIIVGEGEQKLEIEKFSLNTKMKVKVIPMMDREEYLGLVTQSDAGLVILDKNLRANNYPGKSFDYMFLKKPLLCYLHSENEFGRLIENHGLGYFMKADKRDSISSEFFSLISDKEQRIKKGINANKYLEDYFSVERATSQIINKFNRKSA